MARKRKKLMKGRRNIDILLVPCERSHVCFPNQFFLINSSVPRPRFLISISDPSVGRSQQDAADKPPVGIHCCKGWRYREQLVHILCSKGAHPIDRTDLSSFRIARRFGSVQAARAGAGDPDTLQACVRPLQRNHRQITEAQGLQRCRQTCQKRLLAAL